MGRKPNDPIVVNIWRDIPDYPGYQVTRDGHVRSIRNPQKPIVLKQRFNQHMHAVTVQVTNGNGHRTTLRLGKLILDTFKGGGAPSLCVYHLNGNIMDNRLSNLGYRTQREISRSLGSSRRRPCAMVDFHGNVIEVYKSMTDAARKNGVNLHYVYERCKGRTKFNNYDSKGRTYAYMDTLFEANGDSMEW